MKWIEMHPNPSPPIYITTRTRNLFSPLRFGEKRQLPNIKNRSIHGSVHHTIWLENHWFMGWIFDTQVISSPQLRHCSPTKEEGTSHFLRFFTNDGLWWVSKQQNRRICGLEIWKFNLSEAFLKHTRIVMPRVAYQSLTVELGYGFISWIRLNPGTTWLTCSFFFPQSMCCTVFLHQLGVPHSRAIHWQIDHQLLLRHPSAWNSHTRDELEKYLITLIW